MHFLDIYQTLEINGKVCSSVTFIEFYFILVKETTQIDGV